MTVLTPKAVTLLGGSQGHEQEIGWGQDLVEG